MTPTEQFDTLFQENLAENTDFQGIALFDDSGIMLSCHLPSGVITEELVSLGLSWIRVAQDASSELHCGAMQQAMITGSDGYAFFKQVEDQIYLICILDKDTLLGKLFSQITILCNDVKTILQAE